MHSTSEQRPSTSTTASNAYPAPFASSRKSVTWPQPSSHDHAPPTEDRPLTDPLSAVIQGSILEHMKVLDGISDGLATWLLAQPMCFVATAPLAEDGHVNLSPKGMGGTFAVLGPRQVGYLDYFGSGSETIAHLRENGRITVMFSAFEGRPNIVRLYGRGSFIRPGEAEFDELRGRFGKDRTTGQRSIVLIDLDRVQESCGYSV